MAKCNKLSPLPFKGLKNWQTQTDATESITILQCEILICWKSNTVRNESRRAEWFCVFIVRLIVLFCCVIISLLPAYKYGLRRLLWRLNKTTDCWSSADEVERRCRWWICAVADDDVARTSTLWSRRHDWTRLLQDQRHCRALSLTHREYVPVPRSRDKTRRIDSTKSARLKLDTRLRLCWIRLCRFNNL